jgi:hypothetical protein
MAMIGKVRRMHFRQKKTVREIARASESELISTNRNPGIAVDHDLGGSDGAEVGKMLLQGFVAHAVSQVADMESVAHGGLLSGKTCATRA